MNEDDFNQTELLEWFVVKLGGVNNWDLEVRDGNLEKRKYLELKTKFMLDGTSDNDDDDKNKIVISGEFHIVFSFNYQVPVFYFNYYHTNGMYLNTKEIENIIVHNNQGNRIRNFHNINEVVVQMEHPILKRPYFMLHPCRTEATLGHFNLNSIKVGNKRMNCLKKYLITWFQIYGALLNLHLPIIFFKSILENVEREGVE